MKFFNSVDTARLLGRLTASRGAVGGLLVLFSPGHVERPDASRNPRVMDRPQKKNFAK